jgi:predicted metal-binding membrane protein
VSAGAGNSAHEWGVAGRVLRRDRWIAGLALSLLTLLAWFYLVRMARAMDAAADEAAMHAAMGMSPDPKSWGASDALALFLMWAVMMAGMMLPSATPVILLVLATYRRRGGRQSPRAAAAFGAGYLIAWTGFSAAAALAQTALHAAALLSAGMASDSAALAGGIFLLAGVYQWSPWKHACLSHCRSPLHFLTTEWREGTGGAFLMGLRHGLFCVGCCWALMVLLFAAGVMNLVWVAAIALFVLAEKVLPRGYAIGRAAGFLLAAWGVYLMAQTIQ